MPSFRTLDRSDNACSTPESIRSLITDLMSAEHFFQGPSLHLSWQHTLHEDIPWEICKGRLLDKTHTRLRKSFEAWHIYSHEDGVRSSEPILSLKLDLSAAQLHVTRAIHCFGWE